MKFLKASNHPKKDILNAAYAGQPEHMRHYQPGFKGFMTNLPDLGYIEKKQPKKLRKAIDIAINMMDVLANLLVFLKDSKEEWLNIFTMPPKMFRRSIIGISKPTTKKGVTIPGKEVIVAFWGKGFSSPPHGHSKGLLFEYLVHGKVMVNTYSQINGDEAVPMDSTVYEAPCIIAADYGMKGQRENLIHNYIALEPSISLHYVPEHTRDGRDNKFTIKYFDDSIFTPDDYTEIKKEDIDQLPNGSMLLVRSESSKDYGDHFCLILPKEGGTEGEREHIPIMTKSHTLEGIGKSQIYLLISDDMAAKISEHHLAGI